MCLTGTVVIGDDSISKCMGYAGMKRMCSLHGLYSLDMIRLL